MCKASIVMSAVQSGALSKRKAMGTEARRHHPVRQSNHHAFDSETLGEGEAG
jgi:hypothetical protein